MLTPKTIKLVARRDDPSRPHDPPGGPMVPDYESLIGAKVRRFIGRRLDMTIGEEFVSSDLVQRGDRLVEVKTPTRHAAFVPLEGPDAIVVKSAFGLASAEYRKHLQAGDLLPGDAETARWAGVPFDPKFKLAAADKVG